MLRLQRSDIERQQAKSRSPGLIFDESGQPAIHFSDFLFTSLVPQAPAPDQFPSLVCAPFIGQ
jgi:hypothetical protein